MAVIYFSPDESFRFNQYMIGGAAIVVLILWLRMFPPCGPDFPVSLAGLILVGIAGSYRFTTAWWRRITVTDKELINRRGFPFPLTRISREAISDVQIGNSLQFASGVLVGDASWSERKTRLRIIGRRERILAEIDLRGFASADVERLVTALRQWTRDHSTATRP